MTFATRAILAVCFFASGAAGLVYEVLWSRHMRLLFGSTTYSVSVVLAAFMTGLGVGAHIFGRRADRSPSPLRLYGILEMGVGLYALATGPLLAAASATYRSIAGVAALGVTGAAFVKLILAAIVLLPPAILMGGTLPALVRAIAPSTEGARRMIGILYGLNTLGAVVGTVVTGLVLLETVGLEGTMRIAAVSNLGIGLFVYVRSRRDGAVAPIVEDSGDGLFASLALIARTKIGRLSLVGLFISGATAMLYEVVFTRLLALVFGVSSYAFAIVLGIFLCGLALGGLIYGAFSAQFHARVRSFGWLQLVVAILGALAIAAFPIVPRIIAYARQIPDISFSEMLVVKSSTAMLFLLPISIVAGIGVPLLIGILSTELGRLGRVVGDAYMVNTAGTLIGSLATGFFLITWLGSEGALRAAVVVNAALGALWLLALGSRKSAIVPLLTGIFVFSIPAWPIEVYTSSDTSHHLSLATQRLAIEQRLRGLWRSPLYFKEGREGTIGVFQSMYGRSLISNGHPDASDGADMSTQVFLGVVPLAMHAAPRDVLVVGFGSGVSADAAARVPGVASVDCVELEEAVLEAAPHFAHVNHDAMHNPRIHIIEDDARSFVQTTAHTYDVIVSEPSNPWRTGVASLFTRDFYESTKRTLKPGGIFAQWMQLYALDAPTLQLILATFAASFPEVDLYWVDDGNVVIIGRTERTPVDTARVDSLFGGTGVFHEEMNRYWGFADVGNFYARFILDTSGVRRFVGTATELNTDELPLLEYEAPRAVFSSDGRNDERLLAAKLRSNRLAPEVKGTPVSPGWLWLGIAQIHLESTLKDATKVAVARALKAAGDSDAELRVEAARILYEAGATDEALALVDRSLAAGPSLSAPRAKLAHTLRARVLEKQKRPAEAMLAIAIADVGEPSAASMVRLRLELELKQTAAAGQTARRILAAAVPGGPIGAWEVEQVYEKVSERADPRDAIAIIEKLPEGTERFCELLRLRALAMLYAALGDSAKALTYIDRINVAGALSDKLMLTEYRARLAVGDADGAERVLSVLRSLSPETLQEDIASPLTSR